MGLRLPDFAKPIADARAAGKRPAHMVLVSDGVAGLHLRFPKNPVCSIHENSRPDSFDWRFVAGLDVEVNTRSDERRCRAWIDTLMAARPQGLWLRNVDSDAVTRVYFLGRMWMTPEKNFGDT